MTNAEIQVEEYVRTTSGFIAKCIDKSNYGLTFDNTVKISYGEPWDYLLPEDEDIIKHSFNIIDLLELGDYVNGEYVIQTSKTYGFIFFEVTYYDEVSAEERHKFIKSKDIKTIVTKEQFKNMEYKVGGKR